MTRSDVRHPPIAMGLLEQVAAVLRVLGHAHRLKMVEWLVAEKLSVGQLAEKLALPPSAVSQHLSHMKAIGIVKAQRSGRVVHYRVVNRQAINLIGCIRKHPPLSPSSPPTHFITESH